MKHYYKLYLKLLQLGFLSLLTYRANFVNNVISSALFTFLNFLTIMLLTARTSSVFGWTRYELWLLAGIYNVVFSIIYILFSFDEFAEIINKGQLDSWLLKPIDSQFSLSLWKVGYANIFRMITSLGYTCYILFLLHIVPSFMTLLSFVIYILFSVILIYSISFLIMTLLIWSSTLFNLIDFIYYMYSLTRYPREMYKGAGTVIFFLLLPLTLVVVVPTRVLLAKASLAEMVLLPLCSLLLFFLSRNFWKFALKYYTSTSG